MTRNQSPVAVKHTRSPMTINTKISFKEYAKLLLKLAYRKPMMKVIVSVAALMLLWIITSYLDVLPLPKPTYYQYSTLFLIAVAQPLVIYSTIRKSYYSGSPLIQPPCIFYSRQEQ